MATEEEKRRRKEKGSGLFEGNLPSGVEAQLDGQGQRRHPRTHYVSDGPQLLLRGAPFCQVPAEVWIRIIVVKRVLGLHEVGPGSRIQRQWDGFWVSPEEANLPVLVQNGSLSASLVAKEPNAHHQHFRDLSQKEERAASLIATENCPCCSPHLPTGVAHFIRKKLEGQGRATLGEAQGLFLPLCP